MTTRQSGALKTSADIVCRFIECAVGYVLYQRGVYPVSCFSARNQYGITLYTPKDSALCEHLYTLFTPFNQWVVAGRIHKLTLAIIGLQSHSVLEFWSFTITTLPSDTVKEPEAQIRALLRQITASLTFLPLIDEQCTFEVFAQADMDIDAPSTWSVVSTEGKSDRAINNAQDVKLCSLSTGMHRIDTSVCYKSSSII